jgi:hypothetical protein
MLGLGGRADGAGCGGAAQQSAARPGRLAAKIPGGTREPATMERGL